MLLPPFRLWGLGPPYFPVTLSPPQPMLTVQMAPLLSPLNFLCSRSPSFIISPVSSETDYRSLPISLCLSVPASASRGVSVQGISLISHAALRPYVERPLLTKELWMGSDELPTSVCVCACMSACMRVCACVLGK